MKAKSGLWLVRAVAYYEQRIGDVPWLVIGNYMTAWFFLIGLGFAVKGYEYEHMLRIWQPLLPAQGAAMLVPGLLLLIAYLILPSRIGALPGMLIIAFHVHLHFTMPITTVRGWVALAWHVTVFPVLVLLCLGVIGQLTWPSLRALVAIRHAWAKQRIMSQRLAYDRSLMLARQHLEQQRSTNLLNIDHQRVEAERIDLQRRLALQQQQADATYQRDYAQLILEQAAAGKLLKKANAELVESPAPPAATQLARNPYVTTVLPAPERNP